MDRALAQRREPFPVSEKDPFDRVIVGEHGDEDGAAGGVGHAAGDFGAFGRERLRLGAGAVIDGDAVSRLDEVERHRPAHLAKPDKSDVHAALPA